VAAVAVAGAAVLGEVVVVDGHRRRRLRHRRHEEVVVVAAAAVAVVVEGVQAEGEDRVALMAAPEVEADTPPGRRGRSPALLALVFRR